MSNAVVDYAALGLTGDYVAPSVAPKISSMVTAELKRLLLETEAMQAVVKQMEAVQEELIKDYLRSCSFECTYMGTKRKFKDVVEVSKFYGQLNKDYRAQLKNVDQNVDAYKQAQAVAFREEIRNLQAVIIEWAQANKINTQRLNAQTSEGIGFVALRQVDLYN